MHQCAFGGGHRLIQIERFRQVVERAVTIGGGGRRDIGERAHDDDRKARLVQRNAFEQLEPADAGHAHVGEQHRGSLLDQRRERGLGITEFARREPGFAQRGAEHEAHAAVVVDDPHRRLGFAFADHAPRTPSSDTGNISVNTVLPGRLA